MIPTKTLRERLYAALDDALERHGVVSDDAVQDAVEAALQALEDPCLIKTADSLEPIYTLRAHPYAATLVYYWACHLVHEAGGKSTPESQEAERVVEAMRAWIRRDRQDREREKMR